MIRTGSSVTDNVDVLGQEALGEESEQGGESLLLGKISTGTENDDNRLVGQGIARRFHGWDKALLRCFR